MAPTRICPAVGDAAGKRRHVDRTGGAELDAHANGGNRAAVGDAAGELRHIERDNAAVAAAADEAAVGNPVLEVGGIDGGNTPVRRADGAGIRDAADEGRGVGVNAARSGENLAGVRDAAGKRRHVDRSAGAELDAHPSGGNRAAVGDAAGELRHIERDNAAIAAAADHAAVRNTVFEVGDAGNVDAPVRRADGARVRDAADEGRGIDINAARSGENLAGVRDAAGKRRDVGRSAGAAGCRCYRRRWCRCWRCRRRTATHSTRRCHRRR